MTQSLSVCMLWYADACCMLDCKQSCFIEGSLNSRVEGSLNSRLPTIWRVEKQMKSRWDEVKSEERRCNSAKVRRKKIHPRQMLEKSRNAVFFQWFVCRVSRKVGSLKRRVRSHVVRREIKNCTPLWREAHFEAKMYKTHQHRTTFWSWDVEKLHAAGEKHIFKWKCTKHVSFGPLFEVEMLKNCTPLWREAHFQVKMYKTLHSRSTFRSYNVEKLHAAVARSTFPTQNLKKLTVSDHFLKSRSWKICTPLWREAYFQVKMYKIPVFCRIFSCSDVAKMFGRILSSSDVWKLVSESIGQFVS